MPRIHNVGRVRPQPLCICASHFVYVPAVSNVVTNGNGTGTKNVLKETMHFGLSLVSSLLSSRCYYCSKSNTILYLDTVYCRFLLYVSVEINPFKHRYFITQTNLAYLGIVYVTMITGTRSYSTVAELRYTELDDLYQLFVIDTIMAMTMYSNLPSYQLRSHLS